MLPLLEEESAGGGGEGGGKGLQGNSGMQQDLRQIGAEVNTVYLASGTNGLWSNARLFQTGYW